MGVNRSVIQKWVEGRKDFKLEEENGELVLKGSLEVVEGEIYEVHITFPPIYPHCFPKVREVSGRIPRELDRHVNIDDTLCLAVGPEEALLCAKGLSFDDFINQVVMPHLAREFVKSETGDYPEGEYSHGAAGVLEFFQEQTGIQEQERILELLEIATQPNGNKMYSECVCGGGKKFKFCHYSICLKFREMGKERLRYFMDLVRKL